MYAVIVTLTIIAAAVLYGWPLVVFDDVLITAGVFVVNAVGMTKLIKLASRLDE